MANELNVGIGVSGLTVTAQLYTAGAASGAAISCAEIGTTGIYTGNMTGSAATYGVAFLAGGVLRNYGEIVWDGSAEVQQTGDAFARIGASGAGLTEVPIVDANITQVNGIAVRGTGRPDDTWGPS